MKGIIMETNKLKSLYNDANRLEYSTNFELDAFASSADKRRHLTEELDIHLQIGKLEPIKKGEILVFIKKTCTEDGTSFEAYIEPKMCIRLAENLMNVYRICSFCPGLIQDINLSILYQVCSPSFNEDLQKYLLNSGILKEMPCSKYKGMMEKYKTEGFKAIEQELEAISEDKLVELQTESSISKTKAFKQKLIDIQIEMERRGGPINNGEKEFKEQVEHDHTVSKSVNIILYNGVKKAITEIETAINDAELILKEFKDNIQRSLGEE